MMKIDPDINHKKQMLGGREERVREMGFKRSGPFPQLYTVPFWVYNHYLTNIAQNNERKKILASEHTVYQYFLITEDTFSKSKATNSSFFDSSGCVNPSPKETSSGCTPKT